MDEQKSLNMKEGLTYKVCSCGHSKILPLCDESHKAYNEEHGTNYKSVRVTPEIDTEVKVACKNWENQY
ncbi:CDGSH iron-sulfur domain-containing protein [Candidatus Pacearchaeota archaeon]|nr:CDGSH iron-sulfur domain-containing protein [Candidatus Pacearchaeota archaeon]